MPESGVNASRHRRRLELYRQGLNDRQIAEKLGSSTPAINHWRRANSLPPNAQQGNNGGNPERRELTRQDEAEIEKAFDSLLGDFSEKYRGGSK